MFLVLYMCTNRACYLVLWNTTLCVYVQDKSVLKDECTWNVAQTVLQSVLKRKKSSALMPVLAGCFCPVGMVEYGEDCVDPQDCPRKIVNVMAIIIIYAWAFRV